MEYHVDTSSTASIVSTIVSMLPKAYRYIDYHSGSPTTIWISNTITTVTTVFGFIPYALEPTWTDMKECKVTDQKQTGRCWIFATMNMMRLGMVEKFNLNDDFELVRTIFLSNWMK